MIEKINYNIWRAGHINLSWPSYGSSIQVKLEVLVFQEGGKAKDPEKNPRTISQQGENQQQTQLTYDNRPGSSTGHIGAAPHCSPKIGKDVFDIDRVHSRMRFLIVPFSVTKNVDQCGREGKKHKKSTLASRKIHLARDLVNHFILKLLSASCSTSFSS